MTTISMMSQGSIRQDSVQSSSGRFALQPAIVLLSLASLLTAVLCWGVLGFWSRDAMLAFQATAIFAVINWLAGAAGLTLVAMMSGKGSLAVMAAYFGGATFRIAANLMATVVLVLLSMNLLVTLVAVGLTYLPSLAIEAGLVGKYLWQLGEHEDASNSQAGETSGNWQAGSQNQRRGHIAQADTLTTAQATETVA